EARLRFGDQALADRDGSGSRKEDVGWPGSRGLGREQESPDRWQTLGYRPGGGASSAIALACAHIGELSARCETLPWATEVLVGV
ncbi:MAG: hypothetical protein JO372_01210, partial [Solirubrobacterales bacterium]|nr:hypothetical protein [Solirubrobacterales bacterium]